MRSKSYYIVHSADRGNLTLLYGFCEKIFTLRYISTPPQITEGCGLSLRVETCDINLLRGILLENSHLIPKDEIEIYLLREKGIEKVYDLL